MTFHERALMLKAIAQNLMARKDEFYLVSAATGALSTGIQLAGSAAVQAFRPAFLCFSHFYMKNV